MGFEGEDGTGLDMCSERRGTMTAWWRWSGSLKEEGNWDNQRSLREGPWKRSADRRGDPAGPKLEARHKTGASWRTRVAALCASWRGKN